VEVLAGFKHLPRYATFLTSSSPSFRHSSSTLRLDTQNRYVRANLQALLDFSAKIFHRSADTASETSDQLQKKGQR
jgi:hypothetical protein